MEKWTAWRLKSLHQTFPSLGNMPLLPSLTDSLCSCPLPNPSGTSSLPPHFLIPEGGEQLFEGGWVTVQKREMNLPATGCSCACVAGSCRGGIHWTVRQLSCGTHRCPPLSCDCPWPWRGIHRRFRKMTHTGWCIPHKQRDGKCRGEMDGSTHMLRCPLELIYKSEPLV